MTDSSSLPEVTDLLSQIADELRSAAPEKYDYLQVHADFEFADAPDMDGTAHLGALRTSIDLSFAVLDHLEEVLRRFTAAGQFLWREAIVCLTKDGEVSANFTYPS